MFYYQSWAHVIRPPLAAVCHGHQIRRISRTWHVISASTSTLCLAESTIQARSSAVTGAAWKSPLYEGAEVLPEGAPQGARRCCLLLRQGQKCRSGHQALVSGITPPAALDARPGTRHLFIYPKGIYGPRAPISGVLDLAIGCQIHPWSPISSQLGKEGQPDRTRCRRPPRRSSSHPSFSSGARGNQFMCAGGELV